MSPTARTAALVAGIALAGLVLPLELAALALAALGGAVAVDLWLARRPSRALREAPHIVARGIPSRLSVELRELGPGRTRVRQPLPPDVALEPSEADGGLDSRLVARHRGRHVLPPVSIRRTGPLGLGRRDGTALEDAELLAYPDLPNANRLALAVRQGRFREAGRRSRGPLGLGTDFESIRDYLPDDDVRQVNWPATQRVGRPMSNQYRIEQDRDVVCVVDAGRLMGAPLGDRTRLDAAVDAATAVAAVADELGDRCGVVAFDAEVRRDLRPRRAGGRDVVRALFDLEPREADSDYALAFHRVGRAKRAFVLVLTDLLEETAVRPLAEAVPILRRRHHVVVASSRDPGLEALAAAEPARPLEVFRVGVAVDVLAARERAAGALRRAGAVVVDAPPPALGAACVRAYLRAKARARL